MRSLPGITGIAMLIIFGLSAVSVVCLAAIAPSLSSGCGNHMGAPAFCPFMSGGLSGTIASFGKELFSIALILAIAVAFTALVPNDQLEAADRSRYRDLKRPPVSFLNVTLQLISAGVLHSRVFGA